VILWEFFNTWHANKGQTVASAAYEYHLIRDVGSHGSESRGEGLNE
jgi:hypothetical protein